VIDASGGVRAQCDLGDVADDASVVEFK
jgi:hypothetical protein